MSTDPFASHPQDTLENSPYNRHSYPHTHRHNHNSASHRPAGHPMSHYHWLRCASVRNDPHRRPHRKRRPAPRLASSPHRLCPPHCDNRRPATRPHRQWLSRRTPMPQHSPAPPTETPRPVPSAAQSRRAIRFSGCPSIRTEPRHGCPAQLHPVPSPPAIRPHAFPSAAHATNPRHGHTYDSRNGSKPLRSAQPRTAATPDAPNRLPAGRRSSRPYNGPPAAHRSYGRALAPCATVSTTHAIANAILGRRPVVSSCSCDRRQASSRKCRPRNHTRPLVRRYAPGNCRALDPRRRRHSRPFERRQPHDRDYS